MTFGLFLYATVAFLVFYYPIGQVMYYLTYYPHYVVVIGIEIAAIFGLFYYLGWDIHLTPPPTA